MTIVHRWDVSVFAAGDRALTEHERARLDDAVAGAGSVAPHAEELGYGLQIAIAAGTRDEAISIGTRVLTNAARRAGLPDWPVARAEALGEHEQPPAAAWPAPAAPGGFDDDGTPED